MPPTIVEELALYKTGHNHIAGIDEAGRGCWAGPVVAAAVILNQHVLADPALLAGVDDSKALSSLQRQRLYEQITRNARWAIGLVPAHVIDSHGILNATRLAMQIALLRLPVLPGALLIDAVTLHGWPCPQQAIIKGDALCLSIAAASIIAKVSRDRYMSTLGRSYPNYGFGEHKGYGTAAHAAALQRYGPTAQHRMSFRPLQALAAQGDLPQSRAAR